MEAITKYNTENLLDSPNYRRVIKIEGISEKILIKPLTVDGNMTCQHLASTQFETWLKEIGADTSLYKKSGDDTAKYRYYQAMSNFNNLNIMHRCCFKEDGFTLFFESPTQIRLLPLNIFNHLFEALQEMLTYSPSAMDMTAEDVEKMYDDFKKKVPSGIVYSTNELMIFSATLVRMYESLEAQLQDMQCTTISEEDMQESKGMKQKKNTKESKATTKKMK